MHDITDPDITGNKFNTRMQEAFDQVDSNKNSTEPVLTTSLVAYSPLAVIYIILSFFFPKVPQDTLNASAVGAMFIVSFIVDLVTRRKVFSPATVNQMLNVQKRKLSSKLPKPDDLIPDAKFNIGREPSSDFLDESGYPEDQD